MLEFVGGGEKDLMRSGGKSDECCRTTEKATGQGGGPLHSPIDPFAQEGITNQGNNPQAVPKGNPVHSPIKGFNG